MMKEGIDAVPSLINELYAIVRKLEGHFPGRKFTLDGHLVGSIGEVLAAYYYNLMLLPASTETHDARCPEGRLVQVKATQGKSIGLRSEPEHLLVLKLESDGSFSEIYNGPGDLAWAQAGRIQKNGQRAISVSKLRSLMDQVSKSQRLKQRTE